MFNTPSNTNYVNCHNPFISILRAADDFENKTIVKAATKANWILANADWTGHYAINIYAEANNVFFEDVRAFELSVADRNVMKRVDSEFLEFADSLDWGK